MIFNLLFWAGLVRVAWLVMETRDAEDYSVNFHYSITAIDDALVGERAKDTLS